ncbi:MAG: AraC family transcriptional regulator [Clostridia bacterium]|nr:AraC family transcriptional regulator [Clostridia bacterium]
MNKCSEFWTPTKINSTAITPISSGEERCAPGHYWGAGARSCYLIHYIISGKGVFYCGTNKHHVQKGQIFVIYPGTIVKYQADDTAPWHYTWVCFHGDRVGEILSQLGISLQNPVMTVENGSAALELLRSMPTERGAELKNELIFSSRLHEFLAVLLEGREISRDRENVYFSDATRYIKAHYYESITVDSVAMHTGISRKYLFAIFKKALGISPKEYITEYRIKKAKEFLANESLSIGNVAYSVGYVDPLNFSKIFKLKTGYSPSEYRLRSINAAD